MKSIWRLRVFFKFYFSPAHLAISNISIYSFHLLSFLPQKYHPLLAKASGQRSLHSYGSIIDKTKNPEFIYSLVTQITATAQNVFPFPFYPLLQYPAILYPLPSPSPSTPLSLFRQFLSSFSSPSLTRSWTIFPSIQSAWVLAC